MEERSPLSEVLRQIIYDAQHLTREEWAYVFHVDPTDIDDWIADKTIPGPSVIAGFLDLCRVRTKLQPYLPALLEIMSRPIDEISPAWRKLNPPQLPRARNLSDCVIRLRIAGLVRNMMTLPPDVQNSIIDRTLIKINRIHRNG
jgi:hypothetical protein